MSASEIGRAVDQATDPSARVAIVTGAGGALGSAMTARLVADGVRVAAADLSLDAVERVAAELDPAGTRVLPVRLDVTSETSVAEAVAAVVAWAGGVDILVNNAGICEVPVPSWEMPFDVWNRTLAIDLDGVFLCSRAVLPGMIERGWGRIVNISSIAGKEGKNNPVAYTAAKAGVIGLTKAMAFEVAARGVLVNAITPGSIWTVNWAAMPAADRVLYEQRHPVGRFGRAEEVAAMVSWLSGDECSFSTGAVFDISGGRAGY